MKWNPVQVPLLRLGKLATGAQSGFNSRYQNNNFEPLKASSVSELKNLGN